MMVGMGLLFRRRNEGGRLGRQALIGAKRVESGHGLGRWQVLVGRPGRVYRIWTRLGCCVESGGISMAAS